MNKLKSERAERLEKLKKIEQLGINPYPAEAKRTHKTAEVLKDFNLFFKSKKKVFVCGRIRLMRVHGNLSFLELQDESGKIQIALTKKKLGEKYKRFVKILDVGDFIEAGGILFTTHKGEKTIDVKNLKILTKTIAPLPDKWSGFSDTEEKFRKRYLDILFNKETKEIVYKRSIFWSSIREFLVKEGFLEVETPVLEILPGGADAEPFATHHNALDIPVYLRISCGELWQKKLMVAGFEKTFEIGRIFRNEGMSTEHLQDYTQMEFYWAYADYKKGMKFVEKMYKYVAKKTFGTLKFEIGRYNVDMSKKWEIYDFSKIVKKYTGIDPLAATVPEIEKKLKTLKIDYNRKGFNLSRGVDNLWKYCRKKISGPGFLINVPVFLEPLAKRNLEDPRVAERFQVMLAGSELGKGYSELNDPADQEARFLEQEKLRASGDKEAQRQDNSFVEALEYGMPPTCGFGMSERLFAFLYNKPVRECQIFPLMKIKDLNINVSEKIKIKENTKLKKK